VDQHGIEFIFGEFSNRLIHGGPFWTDDYSSVS